MQEPSTNEVFVREGKSRFSLDSLLFWVFSALLFLMPLVFVPNLSVPLLVFKYSLLVVGVVSVLVIWVLLRLKDGLCLFPINMLNLSGLAILAVLLVSSLFSGSIWNSLTGSLPEMDTFIFYLCAFLIMFMIPNVFNSTKKISDIYKVFFVSACLLALFHASRFIFGPNWLSFGYFPNLSDNVLGKWNDLGIFFGLTAVLSLISLELVAISKKTKVALYVILALSVALLAVINFTSIWYVLGILSLVFSVYSIVISRSGNAKKNSTVPLPVTSLVIFLISIAFIIGGGKLGILISDRFNISQFEVVPMWQTTGEIAKHVILSSPIHFVFGAGPNQFLNEWLLYKPTGVNSTIFWNTNFNFGSGIIPSALVTTGVLGFLSWLAFLGILLYMGFRSILSRISDRDQRFLVTSSFLASLYLWLFMVIYVPSIVIAVLTFFFTGLFIASLQEAGILKPTPFEYFRNPKVGFVSVLTLIILLIGGIGLVYSTASKFVGVLLYNQGLVEINKNNIDQGERKIKEAIGFDDNDQYARSLAQLYLVRLSNLLSTSADSTSLDVLKAQFTNISNTALTAAQHAISIDDKSFENWMTIGDVWSALVPFKIDKAYDNAAASYQNAFKYNPQNPYIYLQMAKLETAQNNAEKAKGDLAKALMLKNNYTDAYLYLAQLQVSEGDTSSAIDSVRAATIASPDNAGLFFQLGVLRYNNKQYNDAIGAFEQAVRLNNYYSNAKYFLGLSYYQVDRNDEAIRQFMDLEKLNPGNQEVATILENMKSGRSAFAKPESSQSATTTKKR